MSSFQPTPEQEAALAAELPLLVLAGAGAGKTTVLTRRIARTIAEGKAQPDQVLALTFTDKAATEMAERLAEILGELKIPDAAHQVFCGTFHSFGGLVIRENLLELGFHAPPSVMATAGGWQLLSTIFDDLTFERIDLTGSIGGIFGRLLRFFSQCKDHLIGPDDLQAYTREHQTLELAPAVVAYLAKQLEQLREVTAVYRRYEQTKQERCLIDFGDHLYLTVRLFRKHQRIRDAYRQRYRYIFVDEYQDTNHAQRAMLLELLDQERPMIMVIGDDDQAIYRWRGAIVQNILHFPEESLFAPNEVTVKPLTLNRRSFPPILDLANQVITNVQDRHQKNLDYHEANRSQVATVGHYLAASDRDEGEWIARKILEIEPTTRDLPGKKHGFGAFVVLCRRRSLFEPIGEAMDAAKIPYELIGGTGFYGRWEIRDILSYLQLLAENADDIALARILSSRRWRLGSRDIFHLGEWVRQANAKLDHDGIELPDASRMHMLDAVLSYKDVVGLSDMARSRLADLSQELAHFESLRNTVTLPELVASIVDRTGYRRELEARPTFDSKVALLNLDKLEDLAGQLEDMADGAGINSFVEFVRYSIDAEEQESEVRPIDEETNTVKVMTVHQAKGLEFPVVFVPGLAQGIFPAAGRDESDKWYTLPFELRGDRDYLHSIDYEAIGNNAELNRALAARRDEEKALRLDEERRLFYVAITRAERQIYFSRAHWYGSSKKPKDGSEFWNLVALSGLAEDLGAAEFPANNPNIVGAAPVEAIDTDPGIDTTERRDWGEGAPEYGEARPSPHPVTTSEPDCVPLYQRPECAATSPGGTTISASDASTHGIDSGEAIALSPEALLLSGTDPGLWIEEIVPRQSWGEWNLRRAEVDSHVGSLVATSSTHQTYEKVEVSCSGLLVYLSCPRRYRFIHVDRLPQCPSPWASIGREIHQRIEMLHDRLPTFELAVGWESLDEDVGEVKDQADDEQFDALLDLSPDQFATAGDPTGSIGVMLTNYRRSVYGTRPPTYAEWPFRLLLGTGILRGRIDRLDRHFDASGGLDRWDLVDYKSGRASRHVRTLHRQQLGLYALAVRQALEVPTDRLTGHLLFLRDGVDLALRFDDAELDDLRSRCESALLAISHGDFSASHKAEECAWCDYAHLCKE